MFSIEFKDDGVIPEIISSSEPCSVTVVSPGVYIVKKDNK